MTQTAAETQTIISRRRGAPWTFWAGLALIVACQLLLYIDVTRRGGLVIPYDAFPDELPAPSDALGHLARWVAMNITALCWIGDLLVFDGLLTWLARRRGDDQLSPLRARPNRFIVIWLASIPVWCVFDAINFYLMDAWRYHGLPPIFAQRLLGYFIAFAAILPGMFLGAQLFQELGLRHLRITSTRRARHVTWALVVGPAGIIVLSVLALQVMHLGEQWATPIGVLASALLLAGPGTVTLVRARCPRATAFAIGVGFVVWTLIVHDPLANMTLWVGLWLMLEPINARLGAPSLLEDWLQGRFGRTLSLFAGGALCGLLWEFWNYWAIAKWTYHLPFLGDTQQLSYFEMPALGFLGFLPFAAQCWAIMNTIIRALPRRHGLIAEPLPHNDAVM